MRLLGAILAGGASRRFGSDKAGALFQGRTLVDHVAQALRRDCETLVICGRTHPPMIALEDRPAAGLGPLGGLCAALAHGRDRGFDMVASAPCDMPDLPPDLFHTLLHAGGAAYVVDHPVIGLWPTALADRLLLHLEQAADRSMRGWARIAQAIPVTPSCRMPNINTRADLESLQGHAS